MLLTKLEIKGFKSFADKTVINFNEGITGIVGPNGCGKSNVIDAIRWVLGEQKTKALRSEKMENIIFNGTKNRKAAQMAEVSLTFINNKSILPTEYNNITITRRYYRTGDSEYELNGVKCRLKDVTNLFLDTGINSNSYAIIELKMIDELLNDKENSRRGLFEEAAGISKFKIRKKETIKKLEGTDKDIERIDDILFEIEKNMKSLERQAKQAKKYFDLKKQYKSTSLILGQKKLKEFESKTITLTNKLSEEENLQVQLAKKAAQCNASLEQMKTDILIKEKNLNFRQRTLNTHTGKIYELENNQKIKLERQSSIKQQLDQLHIQKEKTETEKEEFKIEKQSIAMQLESLQKINAEHSISLEEKKSKLGKLKELINEKKIKFDSQKELLNSLEKQYFDLVKEKDILEIKKQQKRLEAESMSERFQTIANEKTHYSDTLKELKHKVQEDTELLNKMFVRQKAINEEKANATIDKERLQDLKIQLEKNFAVKENEFNLQKELFEKLEDYPDSVKFIYEHPELEGKVHLIGDLIQADSDNEAWLEELLQPYLNFLVVDSHVTARTAINLLNKEGIGKATFISVDSLKDIKNNNLDISSQKIKIREKHLPILQRILSSFQTTNEDSFQKINGGFQYGYIFRGGSETSTNQSSKIGRKAKLESMTNELKNLEKEMSSITTQLKNCLEKLEELDRRSLVELINSKERELDLLNKEIQLHKAKEGQIEESFQSIQIHEQDLQDEIIELTEKFDLLPPKIELLSTQIKKHEYNLQFLEEDLSIENDSLSVIEKEYSEANITFIQAESQTESLHQKESFLTNQESKIKSQLKEINDKQEELEQDMLALNDIQETDYEQINQLKLEQEEIENGVKESEKEYFNSRNELEKTDNELKSIQKKRDINNHILGELREELNQFNLQMQSVIDRLQIELGIDAQQIQNTTDSELENSEFYTLAIKDLEHLNSNIKSQIDKMNNINPMALEAFEEIKERHLFINNERQDLIDAKETLLKTIEEINEVAQTAFTSAFHNIKDSFIKVFRTLFTAEDDCDLTLTDPNHPLESKIEIIAKPKGKRPLTINQLSGGEKTLTAISLLFAIYLQKPAPFCIFDEVDAPLDDANIDKFNNIIKEFSNQSQFIIVTHNKRTMASTEIMYGVTMLEQGISRVIPVDLRELSA
ncbi:chromosome segregation protein SMC [Aureibacter tunicatorum]|uniref:Chromosome partition protein Smc n=1 Tax=Aureibacter tunicatorum TaxID=866807 RepID=A0AAE3XN23_9BACT|nr:chromosome segregation protein SMC [Aureibacter tunicatorum]MDR6238973.1 chromosome segregation protein [Aureibacter tunicatorum]BDD05101.1 chromosome partition protein Smc [Aureibacter tunicatorum]